MVTKEIANPLRETPTSSVLLGTPAPEADPPFLSCLRFPPPPPLPVAITLGGSANPPRHKQHAPTRIIIKQPITKMHQCMLKKTINIINTHSLRRLVIVFVKSNIIFWRTASRQPSVSVGDIRTRVLDVSSAGTWKTYCVAARLHWRIKNCWYGCRLYVQALHINFKY